MASLQPGCVQGKRMQTCLKFHRGYIQINPKSLVTPSPSLGFYERDKCLFQAALDCVSLHTNLYLYLDITTDVMQE